MPAGPWQRYEVANNKIESALIDQVNDTFGAMLLVDGHAVQIATNQFVSDVVADEAPATGGYARVAIVNNTVSLNAGISLFNCNDIDFGDAVTISARYCVIYRENGGADSANEVVYICDLSLSGDLSSESGNFDIGVPAGIMQVTPNV
jgi:hypothetical protein